MSIKDRSSNKVAAAVAGGTDKQTLHAYVEGHVIPHTEIFSDEHQAYAGLLKPQGRQALGSTAPLTTVLWAVYHS